MREDARRSDNEPHKHTDQVVFSQLTGSNEKLNSYLTIIMIYQQHKLYKQFAAVHSFSTEPKNFLYLFILSAS